MSKKRIFEVDIAGLRELQLGKPKWFIIRELLQNAIDEDIKECVLKTTYEYGKAHITVTDDSPTGFRDLADTYTLFKDTYKRSDVKKRGRFNFGEKQVLCLSDFARILTTTGGLEFDMQKGTRKTLRKNRPSGSEVYVVVKMTKEEYAECLGYCNEILVPQNITVKISTSQPNKKEVTIRILEYQRPDKIFKAKLPTEKKVNGVMKRVNLETEVHIHKPKIGDDNKPDRTTASYIYEMGIPICEIDCDYSIDVQQKIPLSDDRDNVDSKYIKLIYGEILNQVYDDIEKERSSEQWVRSGFTSERALVDARKAIITKRFGEKVLIANPMDERSMDEAISNNYNVVYGAEMNKEEWGVIKENKLLISTSTMFKTGIAEGKVATPDKDMKRIADFSVRVAKEFLGLNISASFYNSPGATVKADFELKGNKLRFNIAHFRPEEWMSENGNVKQQMLDLIIHELGHSRGNHYEQSYHECITELGSKLTLKALREPEWFLLDDAN